MLFPMSDINYMMQDNVADIQKTCQICGVSFTEDNVPVQINDHTIICEKCYYEMDVDPSLK